jgi:predicted MFS family arabinose efflux permease
MTSDRALLAPSSRPLVAGLALTQTVSWGVLYYAFSVLLVPMQNSLGWSRSTFVGGFTVAVLVSGLSASVVGRLLDVERARPVMSGGSVLGVVAVLAWSQAHSVPTYYIASVAVGLAMAAVLYDPAFTVLAKRTAPNHRRAITAVTLTAGLASFIFQPLTSVLTEHFGWRDALVILAGVLAVVTIPVHLAVLRPIGSPGPRVRRDRTRPPEAADPRFWVLTAAFVGVTTASLATGVLLVAFLVDGGWSLGRAAVAGGTLGAMQLPGRLAFGPLTARLSQPLLVAFLFSVPAAGIIVLAISSRGALVWVAVCLLGFGQGTTTLLRATLFVDLYGTARIGALNGLSGRPITCARALAPLGATVLVARTGGYTAGFIALTGCSLGAAVVASQVLRRTARDEHTTAAVAP